MKKNGDMPCWAALGIVVGLVLIGVFIWQFPTNTSEWAAWVQAFGSIFAIGAAILVARYQSIRSRDLLSEQWDKERVDEIDRRIVQLGNIALVIKRCGDTALNACGIVESIRMDRGMVLPEQSKRLESVLAWLDKLPIASEPGILLSTYVVDMKMKIICLLDLIALNDKAHEKNWSRVEEIRDDIRTVMNSARDFKERYRGAPTEMEVLDN
ncbi:hypothetical protein CLH39_12040 [Alcaligenes faecalis]|uniref:hypothetical protein n=1 Tax=Alcaligenes faecalis TaxID=511 RepID=UPI001931A6CD|nr:hypothetical protein [Alcaligenes faecalis]QRF90919.1 hypothetical protein CLH39_12040 [Alcaligenes faecalis]